MTNVFSETLQKLRKEKGITQEMLAQSLGVSGQAVSKWENGSYPDGDLIPKIADYFGVTIDYLYGRGDKKSSVEQLILESLQEFAYSENHDRDFEKMMDYAWAMQLSAWRQNTNYNNIRKVSGKSDEVTASQVYDKAGFSFMRLNEDLQFYFLAPAPKDGFDSVLTETEKTSELFRFLGDKTNLKILYLMLSLDYQESIEPQTVASMLNIPKEKAEKALSYLTNINGVFMQGKIVTENGKNANIYSARMQNTNLYLMLLIAVYTLIRPPRSFYNQIGWSPKAWFKREDLEFISKKERKE